MTDKYDLPIADGDIPVGETPTHEDLTDNSADDAVPGEVEIEMGTVLTDNTGVSELTIPKIFKDLIADVLLGAASGLATANIVGLPQDKATLITAGWAIANAVVHSLYRFALKLTSS